MKMSEKCPHCEFLSKVFSLDYNGPENNREYWIFTEMFVYLHGGKDYCDYTTEAREPPSKLTTAIANMGKKEKGFKKGAV